MTVTSRRAALAPGPLLDRLFACVLYAAIVLTPTFVEWGGRDTFRVPKELVFRGAAILLGALFAAGLVLGAIRLPQRAELREKLWLLVSAVAVWTTLSGLGAENRRLVPGALTWLAATIVFFVAAYRTAGRSRSLIFLAAAAIPCVVNAVMLLLQVAGIWNPFAPAGMPLRTRALYVALLGNPDDVGGVLVISVVLTVALAVVTRNVLSIAAAAIVLAATLASQTMTALAAVAVAVTLLLLLATRRRIVVVIAVALLGLSMLAYPPVRARMADTLKMGRAGDVNAMLSNRLTVFGAAWRMFVDHPLLGVGPGNFGYAYYDYKIVAEELYPSLASSEARVTNYGEAHSDHLEILAETGIPGYALFLAALILVARVSLQPATDDREQRLARLMALPLAAGLFVSALAHFPLQLTASTALYLYLAAACLAWGRS
jgi:O-antigen ligase